MSRMSKPTILLIPLWVDKKHNGQGQVRLGGTGQDSGVTTACNSSCGKVICVTVKQYAPTFVHRKYQCLSSQGCRPWLWPLFTSDLA